MEELKILVPEKLKRLIGESTPENLHYSCSALLDFFAPLPQYQRVIAELTSPELALCGKNCEKALELKQKGNYCFSKGDFNEALSFYTKALRYASIDRYEKDKNLVATVYVNRAATLHKMNLLEESLRDCNRAVAFSPGYVKAWYRRGKSNMLLKRYAAAVYDFEVAFNLEETPTSKKHIKEDLEVAIGHSCGGCVASNSCKVIECESSVLDELDNIKLECVSTSSKGRGITSMHDILPGSLVHSEEPLAAIVGKPFRESHCHFCFNELPVDVMFCPSCTIPFYCSQNCLEQASGEQNRSILDRSFLLNIPPSLQTHVLDTVSAYQHTFTFNKNFHIPEHRHECGGAHWAAVLPPDIVLAGRLMVNSIVKSKLSDDASKQSLDLIQHYVELTQSCKLELHIYAIFLMHGLQKHYSLDFPPNGFSAAQLVIRIAQIKTNSMAIVRIESLDGSEASKNSLSLSAIGSAFTSNLEQVKVGQAVYSTGSFFNHSCLPNIHAYFLSRRLFIRSTENISAGIPLELSYGPQIGQWGFCERQKILKEHYSFECQCMGCSELSISDIVIDSYCCVKPDCLGAVMEFACFEILEDGTLRITGASHSPTILPVSKGKDISKVADMLVKRPGVVRLLGPGYCLSCGSCRKMKQASTISANAMMTIKRIKVSVDSGRLVGNIVPDALKSLDQLRFVRHPYSRIVAQAEDIVAQIYVSIVDSKNALQHCKTSFQVLEKLYHPRHIVLGNELLKLASIQVCVGDRSAAMNTIKQLELIYRVHYGPHVHRMLPCVASLREAAENLC